MVDLQAWLEAVRNHSETDVVDKTGGPPISSYTAEFGLYDNWPIVMRGNFHQIASDFINSPNEFVQGTYVSYKKTRKELLETLHRTRHFSLDYLHGDVNLAFKDWVGGLLEEYMDDYNVMLMIHGYQKKRVPGMTPTQVKAVVNEDVCRYAVAKKIPFCLPKSAGWHHRDDDSRIVTWTP